MLRDLIYEFLTYTLLMYFIVFLFGDALALFIAKNEVLPHLSIPSSSYYHIYVSNPINREYIELEIARETWLILWDEAVLHINELYLQNNELYHKNEILLIELTRITHDLNLAQNEELINYLKSQQLEILEKMELNHCIFINNSKKIIELELDIRDYEYLLYIKEYSILWIIKKNWIDRYNFY
jgi:hypothetical protein